MRIASTLLRTVLLCGFFLSPCYANWEVDVVGGGGTADQTWRIRQPDFETDIEFRSLSVWRGGGSVAYRFANGTSAGAEISWTERGGSLRIDYSPFRPEAYWVEMRRTHIDLGVRVGHSFPLLSVNIEPIASFRVSRVVKETGEFFSEFVNDWGLGLDPELRIAYGRGFLWSRYYWDLVPPYDAGASEMASMALYYGLGFRIL